MVSSARYASLAELDLNFPKMDRIFDYGTAGFRTKGELLETVCARIGVFGCIRSQFLQGKVCGNI